MKRSTRSGAAMRALVRSAAALGSAPLDGCENGDAAQDGGPAVLPSDAGGAAPTASPPPGAVPAPGAGADAAVGVPVAADAGGGAGLGDASAPGLDASSAGAAASLPSGGDVKRAGPFTPASAAGPSGYVLSYPKELGRDGIKHPIVSWGPGAAENAGMFTTLLNHLASHGFVVISYDATPNGAELTKGIDWLVAEHGRADSSLYQKLDTSKVAVGGHSAGSLATFKVAKDPRITTTLHISGGTFDPHTDIANLHAPALFICGEPAVDGLLVGDVARANCDIDFENAEVPVFYGVTKGASHMTPTEIGDAALRTLQLGAMTAWLRWQLAGDAVAASAFQGTSCGLCSDPGWTVKQKGL